DEPDASVAIAVTVPEQSVDVKNGVKTGPRESVPSAEPTLAKNCVPFVARDAKGAVLSNVTAPGTPFAIAICAIPVDSATKATVPARSAATAVTGVVTPLPSASTLKIDGR